MKKLNLKKILIGIWASIAWIILLWTAVIIYSFIFEKDKIAKDKYNFEQLEKVKDFFVNKNMDTLRFDSLRDFNSQYSLNIKPINNCYYFSSFNWKQDYIFAFQLESLKNKIIYLGNNYIYPKYDLKKKRACFGKIKNG